MITCLPGGAMAHAPVDPLVNLRAGAAAVLGWSASTTERARVAGTIKTVKLGGKRMVRLSELQRVAAEAEAVTNGAAA